MKKVFILAALFICSISISKAQISVAAGADPFHGKGASMFEIRYFGENWPYWSVYLGTNDTIGAELHYQITPHLDLGLGLERSNRSHIVSTRNAYQIRAEYKLTENLFIGIKHRSNGSAVLDNDYLRWARLGDETSKNHGYNYIYTRWKF